MKIKTTTVLRKEELEQMARDTYSNVALLRALSEEYGYMDDERWLRFYKFQKELQILLKEMEISQK